MDMSTIRPFFEHNELSSMRALSDLLWAGVVIGLLGCGSVEPVPPHEEPITDPAQLYMALTFNHPAVTLSTKPGYNTMHLVATPYNVQGKSMSGLPAPTYISSDTSRVQVDSNGVVTVHETGVDVRVIASLKVGSVTHYDTAFIDVTDLASPPVLDSLSIQPGPSDSAVMSISMVLPSDIPSYGPNVLVIASIRSTLAAVPGYERLTSDALALTPRMVDIAGNAINGLRLTYTSLDPDTAVMFYDPSQPLIQNSIRPVRPGQARIVAQTYAYGIIKADTVTYRVTGPVEAQFLAQLGPDSSTIIFLPNEVRIAPYGYVGWFSALETGAVDVTFDNPANVISPPVEVCDGIVAVLFFPFTYCGEGDVLIPPVPNLPLPAPSLPNWTLQIRQFPHPGVYSFRSTSTGATGRIVVTADPYGN